MNKDKITIEEFNDISQKLEIRLGLITNVSKIPKSNKLLNLTVSFGNTIRTVITNIGDQIESHESLVGQSYPFVTNLIPVKIMGVISEAMILPLNSDGVYSGITTAPNGAVIL